MELSLEAIESTLGEQLASANGRRKARVLTAQALLDAAQEALSGPLGYAFRHGGQVDDARARTTLALAVRTARGVVLAVAEAGARQVTPARAWPELSPWSLGSPATNLPRCEAWAARPREDRLEFTVARAAPRDDGERLLARVLDAPDDDQARRVYGDHLSERGDPRGEFIALQCALAELPTGAPEREALLAKDAALRSAHEESWLAALGLDAVTVKWERGFLAEATVLATAVVRLPRGVFEREPLRALRVVDATRDHAELIAAHPALDRLRSLTFTTASGRPERALGPEGAAALLESRHLRALTALAFEGQYLEDTGAMVLAQYGGPVFPRVRSFTVAGDELSSVGAEVLSGAKWFRALERVSLPRNVLRGAEAMASLIDPLAPLAWKSLVLDENPVGDEGARALAAERQLSGLEVLSLSRCGLKQPGARALLEARTLRDARLELSGNRLDPLTEARWKGRAALTR